MCLLHQVFIMADSIYINTLVLLKCKKDKLIYSLSPLFQALISKTSRGSSLKFFNPSDVLPAECITCLVNLVSDPATKPTLVLKCLLLFINLGESFFLKIQFTVLNMTWLLSVCLHVADLFSIHAVLYFHSHQSFRYL